MKYTLSCTLGCFLLIAAPVFAGPLYGTVKLGNASAAGIEVSVACPGFERPAHPPLRVVTDLRGSFSLRVPASGRCQMRLRRDQQIGLPFEVFVSNNPVRFDFVIDNALNKVR